MAESKKKPAAKKAPKTSVKKPAGKTAKKPPAKPEKKLPAHGTRTRYVRHKCRCHKCTAANRRYKAKHRAEQKAKLAKVPRGPNLNATQQSIRDTLIVTRRAQNWPWDAIAQEVELSVSATQKAYENKKGSMDSLLEVSARAILENLIEGLQFSIGDLEQLAVAAVEERNLPAAVSAKKASNEAREKLQDLLQTTGVLPHDLGVMRHQFEFRVVAVKIVALVQTFVATVDALDLPADKRPLIQEAAAQLTTGLEQLDAEPSTNGGSAMDPKEPPKQSPQEGDEIPLTEHDRLDEREADIGPPPAQTTPHRDEPPDKAA